jgi:hypothetical protein
MLRTLLIVGILGTSTLVHAASVLTTAQLHRGGVPFFCSIVNVGKSTVSGSASGIAPSGVVQFTGSFDLEPGEGFNHGILGGSATIYCKFTLDKGSKSSVRANACALSSVDTSGPCLSTSEAR